jgi:hypothetical protein
VGSKKLSTDQVEDVLMEYDGDLNTVVVPLKPMYSHMQHTLRNSKEMNV